MAKENLNKEPIVDNLTPLKGTFKMHGAMCVRKDLKDILDRDGNLRGSYYQLTFADGKRVLNMTCGSGETAPAVGIDPLLYKYDVGFDFQQDKNNENLYKLRIVDYKKSLNS